MVTLGFEQDKHFDHVFQEAITGNPQPLKTYFDEKKATELLALSKEYTIDSPQALQHLGQAINRTCLSKISIRCHNELGLVDFVESLRGSTVCDFSCYSSAAMNSDLAIALLSALKDSQINHLIVNTSADCIIDRQDELILLIRKTNLISLRLGGYYKYSDQHPAIQEELSANKRLLQENYQQ